MGKYPDNVYKCPCGREFNAFSNYCIHRRECETFKESRRADYNPHHWGTPADPPPGEGTTAERPECPYCDTDVGNWPLLFLHMKNCVTRKRKEYSAEELVKDFSDVSEVERHLAFEAWCQENGRP